MIEVLVTFILIMLALSMIVFFILNIYECIASHKFYKRMVKQHNEFMKILEKGDNND